MKIVTQNTDISRTLVRIKTDSKNADKLTVECHEGKYARMHATTTYSIYTEFDHLKELLSELVEVVSAQLRLMFTWNEVGQVTQIDWDHLGSDEDGNTFFKAKLKAKAVFTNEEGNLDVCEVETKLLSGQQIGPQGVQTLRKIEAEVHALIEEEKQNQISQPSLLEETA